MTNEEREQVIKLYHLDKDSESRTARIWTHQDEYAEEYVHWLESQVSKYIGEKASKMRNIIQSAKQQVLNVEVK